jgi:hypothetical protein
MLGEEPDQPPDIRHIAFFRSASFNAVLAD